MDPTYDPKAKCGESPGKWRMPRRFVQGCSCLVLLLLKWPVTLLQVVVDRRPSSHPPAGVPPAPPRRIRSSTRSLSSRRDVELTVLNEPAELPFKRGEAAPRRTRVRVLPVDFGYYYNPSVLELDNGRHAFALRMGWMHGGDCRKHSLGDDPVDATFHCLKLNKDRFVDQTLLGEYDPTSRSLVVHDQGPSSTAVADGAVIGDGAEPLAPLDVTDWDAGAFWHDTRLLFPHGRRPAPGLDRVWVTSQNIEILGCEDWKALSCGSSLVLQLTYLAHVDPGALLGRTSVPRARGPSKMTRWLFYDPDLERQEQERRCAAEATTSAEWRLSSLDVARLKCGPRPPGLPALPFDSSSAVAAAAAVDGASLDEERHVAALRDDWYFVKDKNWAPFVHGEVLLWSYSLFPNHVVCENDIDLTQVPDDAEVVCVLCIPKYNSSSASVLDEFMRRIRGEQGQGVDGGMDAVAHLNGAPAYLVPERGAYVGLMHVIKTNRSEDGLGWERRTKTYEHYFYTTEAEPPFRVAGISTRPVPLSRSRAWSHWFDVSDEVMVEFAMYMQYHPDRPGREIVISYGEGDRRSRIATMGVEEIWSGFSGASPRPSLRDE